MHSVEAFGSMGQTMLTSMEEGNEAALSHTSYGKSLPQGQVFDCWKLLNDGQHERPTVSRISKLCKDMMAGKVYMRIKRQGRKHHGRDIVRTVEDEQKEWRKVWWLL